MGTLKIHNHVFDRLVFGVHIFQDIQPISIEDLNNFLKQDLKQLRSTFEEKKPDSFSFTQKLYKSFSTDPTKTRPASEKLWRRVRKSGFLPAISPIVDITNHLSLKFQIPFGLYDLDHIADYIDILEGTESQSLLTIGNMDMGLKGKIMLSDAIGPFGNPTADSKRTATRQGTRNIIQSLYFHPLDPGISRCFSDTLEFMESFFHWDKSQHHLLTVDNPQKIFDLSIG